MAPVPDLDTILLDSRREVRGIGYGWEADPVGQSRRSERQEQQRDCDGPFHLGSPYCGEVPATSLLRNASERAS